MRKPRKKLRRLKPVKINISRDRVFMPDDEDDLLGAR